MYEQLSKDPNSLANLDQDLPNYAQHSIPIFSLPQPWLWCESWCGNATKQQVGGGPSSALSSAFESAGARMPLGRPCREPHTHKTRRGCGVGPGAPDNTDNLGAVRVLGQGLARRTVKGLGLGTQELMGALCMSSV